MAEAVLWRSDFFLWDVVQHYERLKNRATSALKSQKQPG